MKLGSKTSAKLPWVLETRLAGANINQTFPSLTPLLGNSR